MLHEYFQSFGVLGCKSSVLEVVLACTLNFVSSGQSAMLSEKKMGRKTSSRFVSLGTRGAKSPRSQESILIHDYHNVFLGGLFLN